MPAVLARGTRPGAGDEHVDLAELVHRGPDCLFDRLLVGDVDGGERGAMPTALESRRHVLPGGLVDVGDDDGRAVLGAGLGARSADA